MTYCDLGCEKCDICIGRDCEHYRDTKHYTDYDYEHGEDWGCD